MSANETRTQIFLHFPYSKNFSIFLYRKQFPTACLIVGFPKGPCFSKYKYFMYIGDDEDMSGHSFCNGYLITIAVPVKTNFKNVFCEKLLSNLHQHFQPGRTYLGQTRDVKSLMLEVKLIFVFRICLSWSTVLENVVFKVLLHPWLPFRKFTKYLPLHDFYMCNRGL